MVPIFPKWTNKIPLYLALGIVFALVGAIGFIWYYFSPKYTAVGYEPEQPIAFSHAKHAGELGLDCRYCHSTVEKTQFAALPSTATCMGCHNKIKSTSPRIALLKTSFEQKTPVPWVQVNFVPRYAHFDHSAHVTAGVNCSTCHGRVDTMETIHQVQPLSMGWCLECHNNPNDHLVPKDQVTNMIYNHKDPNTFSNLYSGSHSAFLQGDKERMIQPPTACGACHY